MGRPRAATCSTAPPCFLDIRRGVRKRIGVMAAAYKRHWEAAMRSAKRGRFAEPLDADTWAALPPELVHRIVRHLGVNDLLGLWFLGRLGYCRWAACALERLRPLIVECAFDGTLGIVLPPLELPFPRSAARLIAKTLHNAERARPANFWEWVKPLSRSDAGRSFVAHLARACLSFSPPGDGADHLCRVFSEVFHSVRKAAPPGPPFDVRAWVLRNWKTFTYPESAVAFGIYADIPTYVRWLFPTTTNDFIAQEYLVLLRSITDVVEVDDFVYHHPAVLDCIVRVFHGPAVEKHRDVLTVRPRACSAEHAQRTA